MDLFDSISAFIAVADAGSFSAAARRSGVSVSSMTRSVSALERDLGATLIRRSTHDIGLTEAGRVYLPHAKLILDGVEDARSAVAGLDADPKGTLRVHAPGALGRRHVSPLIPELLRRYPHLTIELLLSDDIVDLRRESIDVALRIAGFERDATLISRPLVPDRSFICASQSYVATSALIERPGDLAAHTCLKLFHGARRGGERWQFRRAEKVESVAIVGRLRATDCQVILDATKAGSGVAMLPEWLVAPDIAASSLVRLLAGYEATASVFDSSIEAVYLPAMRRSLKVKCFVNHLALHLPKCLPRAADGRSQAA